MSARDTETLAGLLCRAADECDTLDYHDVGDHEGRNKPCTVEGKRRVIGNGVPLQMGRAVARAVKRALGL